MNYYNEFDSKAAEWLTELIRSKAIPDGEVDVRSIVDVQPEDLKEFTQCHFFAGIGGWSYALQLAGWPEDQPVWTGSCPCQPFSYAGKQRGTKDERHLWPEFNRLISECHPPVVFGEQVASKLGRDWLASVQTDLEALGYATAAADLCAASVGAPHIRQRLWWVADSCGEGCKGGIGRGETGAKREPSRYSGECCGSGWFDVEYIPCADGKARPIKPKLIPLVNGVPGRMGLLRGYGNAIVPQVASQFIRAYTQTKRT